MNRVGRKSAVRGGYSYGIIDQLRYSYTGTGNQLRNVVDQAGASAAPNDFEDVTPASGDDYAYDYNGNMTRDANKGLIVGWSSKNGQCTKIC
ncbi:MAG TPA: hypothetical protein VF629_05855 [Hymenobacter sp.]